MRRAQILLFVLLILGIAFPSSMVVLLWAESTESALRDIREGWRQELVYQQELLSPIAMCYDSSENLYVYDYGTRVLFMINQDGQLKEIADTGEIALRALAWQPNRERLVGFDILSMYEVAGNRLNKVGNFGRSILVSTVTIDQSDDSIYAGHEDRGRPIVHLDAEGRFIETVNESTQGCFQLAYDEKGKTLYFSETFTGSISALDMKNNMLHRLIGDLAVPGTPEPIALCLDDDRRLWFYTAFEGLHRYENGRLRKIIDPMMGAGPMIWSNINSNWIAIQYAGSNLVSYDYRRDEQIEITPSLNATDIAEDAEDRVYFPRTEFVYTLAGDGPIPFSEPLPDICEGVELDREGRVYAALGDGRIYRIAKNGEAKLWLPGLGFFSSMVYDAVHDDMIVVGTKRDAATVYRVPVSDPKKARGIATVREALVTNTLPRVTVDAEGVIYLLEWERNEIMRVNETTGRVETLYRDILPSRDITVPSFQYSRIEDAFVVGTLEYYHLISRVDGARSILAMNSHGADNFGIYEKPGGTLVFIHSGQIFRLRRKKV
jgi:sugar lactone lactonase YvrE